MEDIAKQELFAICNKLLIEDEEEMYERSKFVCNEYAGEKFDKYVERASRVLSNPNIIELDKKKQVTINELKELVEEEAKK